MTGRISRVIASGIGLGRESYAHHQAQKQADASAKDNAHLQPEVPGRGTHDNSHLQPEAPERDINASDDDGDELDELLWNEDDVEHDYAQADDPPPLFEDLPNDKAIVDKFLEIHGTPTNNTGGHLPSPVCIPQRRPKHRTRGFVRAYAPALQGCGIDQKTFFDFLDGFEQAIKMHQAFNAVQPIIRGADLALQIASGGNLVIHAASWVLHASVEAGRRAYVQYKTNEYLDRMNVVFFQKHGLYALIMCYKPTDSPYDVGNTVNESVARRANGRGDDFSRKSGTSKSELELPDACPLVFPQTAKLFKQDQPNAAKRAGNVLSEYYDRRSQAQYDYDHPGSKLSLPEPAQFASKYSNPTTAASSGGILGLVSGGKITGPRYRRKQSRRSALLEAGQSVAPRSRLISEDVLYLMIVNMPSDAEIKEAQQMLIREQGY